MLQVYNQTNAYRQDMLQWRKDESEKERVWRREREEKEDKDRRVMMLVKIDKMSYGDAYTKVYGFWILLHTFDMIVLGYKLNAHV